MRRRIRRARGERQVDVLPIVRFQDRDRATIDAAPQKLSKAPMCVAPAARPMISRGL
jgi:hypothetical protein